MAKSSSQALLPFIAVIGFLSLLGLVLCEESLTVEGSTYCDTCRILFVTKLSTPVAGAKVRLTCRDRIANDLTLTLEGETDETGAYKIQAEGDHEEEICEVQLLESPEEGCNTIAPGLDTARVLITSNNGVTDSSRYVNPLGFLKNETLEECPEVLRQMGIMPQMLPTDAIPTNVI